MRVKHLIVKCLPILNGRSANLIHLVLTFQNVVDWVAVLPGRGEDGKDILSDFELLIWGFARNEDF